MINIINRKKERGFTIVELLVVIVVIGVLAAITIVSYTGVTSRANTSTGQSNAGNVSTKASIFAADGPTGTWPTTYGSLKGADAASLYYVPLPVDFTIASGNKPMDYPTYGRVASLGLTNDSIDFYLCGTTGAAGSPANYTAITVPTGVKIGYWNFSTLATNTADNSEGVTSGVFPLGTTNNVACFKVGIAESAVAVAKAYYNEHSRTWPDTATDFLNNTVGAEMSPTASVSTTAPGTGNGKTVVSFECGTAVALTLPCDNTGGRITYWDFAQATPAVATITYGTAVNFAAPAS